MILKRKILFMTSTRNIFHNVGMKINKNHYTEYSDNKLEIHFSNGKHIIFSDYIAFNQYWLQHKHTSV